MFNGLDINLPNGEAGVGDELTIERAGTAGGDEGHRVMDEGA